MNMFNRFQTSPLGFDSFNAWMRHCELFSKFPLGCNAFGKEWLDLWLGLGELLKMRARVEVMLHDNRSYEIVREDIAVDCLEWVIAASAGRYSPKRRVVLLDGTIIKEWGPR